MDNRELPDSDLERISAGKVLIKNPYIYVPIEVNASLLPRPNVVNVITQQRRN